VLLLLDPDAIELSARIASPQKIKGVSLERVLTHVVRTAAVSFAPESRRIVQVCANLQPGGAERQLVYTLQGLVDRDVESVQLLCHNLTRDTNHRYDFYLPSLEAFGITPREVQRRTSLSDPSSIPLPLRKIERLLPSSLTTDIANLYWEFTEIRPEIVHAWLDWDNVRAGLAGVLAGVPKVILSGRNINPSHFALYQPYMEPAYRLLARHPSVTLINNSRAGADDYADWIGIPRDQIVVVYNGVDFRNRGRLTASAAAAFRTSLGVPADAYVTGGVVRLEEEKRPLLWVKTAARVANAVPSAWFVLFGQGRMRDQVERTAKQLGLGKRLVLAGITEDVISAMSIMDVLLLTSSGEGLPNVVLEAQWAGTPVVATDVGGTKEAMELGMTGWALPSSSANDLADRIVWLHEHPHACLEARTRGPLFVREKFGIERMLRDTMSVYGFS
jgi:glycosyltransferase involved in cell wall biosynthesis